MVPIESSWLGMEKLNITLYKKHEINTIMIFTVHHAQNRTKTASKLTPVFPKSWV